MEQNSNGMTSGEMIFAAIYSLSQRIMMLYSKAVLRETGLNWQDWRILRAVVSMQSCRAQDICTESGIKKSHVSNGLARLEVCGHISRVENKVDGRSRIIMSTEQFQKLVARAQPRLQEFETQISNQPDVGDPDALLSSLMSYKKELGRLLDGDAPDQSTKAP
jgi:DNA-binding MarR family transcriptional regulator